MNFCLADPIKLIALLNVMNSDHVINECHLKAVVVLMYKLLQLNLSMV